MVGVLREQWDALKKMLQSVALKDEPDKLIW
jgi:hypothetical protein